MRWGCGSLCPPCLGPPAAAAAAAGDWRRAYGYVSVLPCWALMPQRDTVLAMVRRRCAWGCGFVLGTRPAEVCQNGRGSRSLLAELNFHVYHGCPPDAVFCPIIIHVGCLPGCWSAGCRRRVCAPTCCSTPGSTPPSPQLRCEQCGGIGGVRALWPSVPFPSATPAVATG